MNVSKSEDELIRLLRTDGKEGVLALYKVFKSGFVLFAKRYSDQPDLRIEAYHEGVLGFYRIFKAGRYDPHKAGIKTLITQIGKNHLINRLKKDARDKLRDIEASQQNTSGPENVDVEEVREIMAKLGPQCREVLTYFYYHNYSIEAIMLKMEYKNENVVKSHKARCLKQLRSIMQGSEKMRDG